MVTPLLPLFLTGALGATPLLVGLVEGAADAASQCLKLVSGRLADARGGHRGLAVGGYALSNLARPLIGLAGGWGAVAVLRTMDRAGKGLRTAPRDALLAASAPPHALARAFGFQRSMDHLGAMLGPLLAFAALSAGASLPQVFLLAAVPGAWAVWLMVRVDVDAPARLATTTRTDLGWRELDPATRRLVLGGTLVAFAGLPEAFLVLWMGARGMAIGEVVLVWSAAHLVRTAVAYPAAVLAERIGRRQVVLGGWLMRAALLAVFVATEPSGGWVAGAFIAYGIATAWTEGAERALVAEGSRAEARGSAFGWYAAFPGLAALPGALLFGALWTYAGSSAAFATASALALLAAALFRTARAAGA
jgi:hypothetical protein